MAQPSSAGGLECAEQSMVRFDPEGKEVVPFPFTVRAMLSGPSEEETTHQRGLCQAVVITLLYSQLITKFTGSLVPLLTGLNA